ncbi:MULTISPECIES: hypothetical protein [Micromonospora]|uniref:Uncharacterized protein n=1 Tax=Micromonospora solifontis TaxID=2487138 RepID=A0ABX9W9J6_9ACTN|nr:MULTISPECIES: hypothetical protein [Micromonospora]NES14749.1 hypothetical protein [Micromonospora sp. PPF5-17B]NES39297.1 hypothetical protein [Micromonospora solifontis]NES56205.1 hypothetical protein [Micromonospora sp. PPF5-6]RNL89619.1 hypothetical protein EFE23_24725 [Micromonospora solifontis]
MSEYQYYEFTAVDRPLTGRERAELRSLSTRADITATSFVNTYEWGNFKGDPRTLMERYFDAHLYLANWGTRQLMLRLPKNVLDPATVARYCQGDSASAWTASTHVIIDLHDEDEDGTDEWDLDGHGLLASIIPVRAGLAAGDLRLLYLAWLRCVQSAEIADDEPEPPAPDGLGSLDASLTAVAEFLRIDPDLIAAAAAGSSPAGSGEPTAAQLRTWVVGLPVRDKDAILADLITGGDSHLRNRLLRRYRDAHPTDASIPTAARTAGELLATAADLRAERERLDAERRERDRVRRERSAAAARQRHLDTLASDQPAAWQRVDELIATKKPREYDTAVQLLVDLRELSERDEDSSSFQHRLAELRAAHARKPSLLERLNLAGLDT